MSIAVPYVKIKVFHSTYTGPGAEIFYSFLKNGADPHISDGHGQGKGFYVWTTLEQARAHIEWLKEGKYILGYPLIVESEVTLNPQEWDLDYECNMELIVAFIWGHWDTFQKIPDNALRIRGNMMDYTLCPSKSKKMGVLTKFIRFILAADDGSEMQEDVMPKKKYNEPNTQDAAMLGQIFNFLQKYLPDETNKFESSIFLKMVSKKNMAIKYVGSKNLPIRSFQIQADNEWVYGEKALKYIQERKAA